MLTAKEESQKHDSLKLEFHTLNLINWAATVVLFLLALVLANFFSAVVPVALLAGGAYSSLSIMLYAYVLRSALESGSNTLLALIAFLIKLPLLLVFVLVLDQIGKTYLWNGLAGMFIFIPSGMLAVWKLNEDSSQELR